MSDYVMSASSSSTPHPLMRDSSGDSTPNLASLSQVASSSAHLDIQSDLDLLAGPTPFFYTSTIQRSNAVTHAVTGHFTSANELNLIIAKTDRLEVHQVTPSGLKLLVEVPIFGCVAALHCFTPKRAKWIRNRLAMIHSEDSMNEDTQSKEVSNQGVRVNDSMDRQKETQRLSRLLEMGAGQDLLFLANDEFRFAILAFDPAAGEVKTLSYGSWNTPPSADHVADGGMSVRIDPTSSCVILHGHRGLLQLIRLTAEGLAEKQAFPLRFDAQQTVDVSFLPLEPAYPPVVLILAQDAFERRHLKSYTIVGVDTRSPPEYAKMYSTTRDMGPIPVPAAAALMLSAQPKLVPGPWPHVLVDVSAHRLLPLPISEPELATDRSKSGLALNLPNSHGGVLVISVQNVAYFQATTATQEALEAAGAATLEAASRLVSHAHARPHTVVNRSEDSMMSVSNNGNSYSIDKEVNPPQDSVLAQAQDPIAWWRMFGGVLSDRSWVGKSRQPLLSNQGLLADAASALSLAPLPLSSLVKTFLPSPRGECTSALVLKPFGGGSHASIYAHRPARVCMGLEHGLIYCLDVTLRQAPKGVSSSSSKQFRPKHIAELRLQRTGSVGSPEAIAQLDDHYFFIGSTKGDSQLIHLTLPSLTSGRSQFTSTSSSSSSSSSSAAPDTPGLRVIEVYRNAGPVSDMLPVPPKSDGLLHVPALVTCSGAYRQGVLGIFRPGVRLSFESSILEIEGLQRMFGLQLPIVSQKIISSRQSQSYVSALSLAFAQESRLLTFQGDTMMEQDFAPYEDANEQKTTLLHAASFVFPNAAKDHPALILSCTSSNLALVTGEAVENGANSGDDMGELHVSTSSLLDLSVEVLIAEACTYILNSQFGAVISRTSLTSKSIPSQKSFVDKGFTSADAGALVDRRFVRITHVASNKRGQVLVAVSLPPAGISFPRRDLSIARSVLLLLQVCSPNSPLGALTLIKAVPLANEVSALDITPLGSSLLVPNLVSGNGEQVAARFACPIEAAVPTLDQSMLPLGTFRELEGEPSYFAVLAMWGEEHATLLSLPTLEQEAVLDTIPFSSAGSSKRRHSTSLSRGGVVLPTVSSVFGALSNCCRSLKLASLGAITFNSQPETFPCYSGLESWSNLILACAADTGTVTTFGLELNAEALKDDFEIYCKTGNISKFRPKLIVSEPKHLNTGPSPVQFTTLTSCPVRNEAARVGVRESENISTQLQSSNASIRRMRHLFVAGSQPRVISLSSSSTSLTHTAFDSERGLRGRILKIKDILEKVLLANPLQNAFSVPSLVKTELPNSDSLDEPIANRSDAQNSSRPSHPPVRILAVPDISTSLAVRLHNEVFPDTLIVGTSTSVAVVSMAEERNPYDPGYPSPLVGLDTKDSGVEVHDTSKADMMAASLESSGVFATYLSSPTASGLVYDAIPLNAEPRRMAISSDLDVLAVTVIEPAEAISLGPAGVLNTVHIATSDESKEEKSQGYASGVYDTVELIPVARTRPLEKPEKRFSPLSSLSSKSGSDQHSFSHEPRTYIAPPDTAELASDGAGPSSTHPKMALDNAGVRFFDLKTFAEFARLQLLPHEEALSICELKLPFLEPGSVADIDKAAEIVMEIERAREQLRTLGVNTEDLLSRGSIKNHPDGAISKDGLTLTSGGDVLPDIYSESVFVIGTGYIFNDEPEPTRGRILLVRADPVAKTLSILAHRVIRGAVTSVKSFLGGGAFVAGVNSTVHVYRLRSSRVASAIEEMLNKASQTQIHGSDVSSSSSGIHKTGATNTESLSAYLGVDPLPYTIIPHCANTGHLYVLQVRPFGTNISVASLNQSVSMLHYAPSTKTLNVVARDHVPRWATAIESCTAQTMLVADDEGYLNALVRASGFSPSVRADAEALFPAIAPYLSLLATRAGVFSDHRGWLRVVSRTMLNDTVNVIVQGSIVASQCLSESLSESHYSSADEKGYGSTPIIPKNRNLHRFGAATASLANALHAFLHHAAAAVAKNSSSQDRSECTPAASYLLSTTLSPLDTAMLLRPPAPTHTVATRNGSLLSISPLSRPQYVTMRALQTATHSAFAAESAFKRAAQELARHLLRNAASSAPVKADDVGVMIVESAQKRVKTEIDSDEQQSIMPRIPDHVLMLLPSCLRQQFYLGAERALVSKNAEQLRGKHGLLSPFEERKLVSSFASVLLSSPIHIYDDSHLNQARSPLEVAASVQIETVPLPEAEALAHAHTGVGGIAVIAAKMAPETTDASGGFIDGDMVVHGFRSLAYQAKLVVVRILAEWLRGDMIHKASEAASTIASASDPHDHTSSSASTLSGLDAVNRGTVSSVMPSPLSMGEAHELVALLTVYVDALAQTQGLA